MAAMAMGWDRWTLEDLIDFTVEIDASPRVTPESREAVSEAVRNLDGVAAKREGLRAWLELVRGESTGTRFLSALSMAGAVLCVLMFLAGISGVLGMLDHARNGVNVTLFIVILLGGQWLVLLAALVAAMARRRSMEGFSLVQSAVAKVIRRFAGEGKTPWWSRLMGEGGAARGAVLWRVARVVQAGGICFNLGLLAGLGGLVMFRHVGFFWETTTEWSMHDLLCRLTRLMALPWSSWWPEALPDPDDIKATRWFPGRELSPGPAVWWSFLLLALFFWGLLPRLLLWLLAWRSGGRALAALDFQSRPARALWRDLTTNSRADSDDKPLDGVLVLDVGGCGLTEESLRPFLLRGLRVHPSSWHQVAVLDEGSERGVSEALGKAPAGVVLLAEGWALSPPRMKALHERIRARAGRETPMQYLVANVGAGNTPVPPSREELREWERFVDALADPHAEVHAYADAQAGE